MMLLQVQKPSAAISAEVILGYVQNHGIDIAVKLSIKTHTAASFVGRAVKTKADKISFPITALHSPQMSRSHVVLGAITNTLYNIHLISTFLFYYCLA